MSTIRRTSLRTYIGQALTMFCTVRSVVDIIYFIVNGNGFGVLASMLSAAALICLFVSVNKYHDCQDMSQWPAIFMTAYIASNLFLISVHWTYILVLLPLVAMVLLLSVFNEWWVPGVSAGVLMVMLNFVIGVILYKAAIILSFIKIPILDKVSSFYIASLFVRQLFLMGIACILFFCSFPAKESMGNVNFSDSPSDDSGDGFM